MKLKALALGAVSALALTACGGTTPSSTPSGDASASSSAVESSQAAPESITVGIVNFVSHPALDAAQQGFIDALAEAGYVEGENVTFDVQNPQTDQATLTNIANTFAASDYDGFLAIATPAAQALANVITDRPIVFAAVTDPVAAGLVSSWDVA